MLHGLVLLHALVLGAQEAASARRDAPAIVLEGVIVTQNPANAVALVRRGSAARARAIRVGQTVDGHVLSEVTRDSVLFQSERGPFRLYLAGAEPPAAASAVPSEPSAPVWERREFRRGDAQRRLEREIPVILDETRLVPRVQEGEVRGLSLERIPDGTLLSESGLAPGDVLLSLNGEPLYSLTELWGLLARLAATEVDELELVVERGGEELKLAYALTR